MSRDWSTPLRLHELGRGAVTVRLEPDAPERAKVAHDLGFESLPKLTADLTLRPWLDGAEITGRFAAVVEQLCSVSLEPFEHPLQGEFTVQVLPKSSPNAAALEAGASELDPNAADPPDLIAGDAVDLAAYVVEHLALEVDPFPRKPGAEFDFEPNLEDESPFAALKALKDPKP